MNSELCFYVNLSLISFSTREAREFFLPGKQRDGYFTNDNLVAQVEKAIDIFEAKTHGFVKGLFLFDNATTHRKRASDALSALKMPLRPKAGWVHNPKEPRRMRDGTLPDGTAQPLYFPDDHPTMPGWFKGMEQIVRERGLHADAYRRECPGFKCEAGATSCCLRRLLYLQPDFMGQKSLLEETIEARGHICDFYPKFHCELNFIEQYWGASKLRYRSLPYKKNLAEMKLCMVDSLDFVPLIQIRR